eukprot:TRINITY_DN10498_c0_g1_i1.p1 TRINITY_DN10498_c0_g1~~TRINITY_DN10498_c0_g1_i1.p1  ORF type:complete len:825 (+),score=206.31 TRINITY_DN10498_c0_g1_i1:38-2512(+)
MTKDEDFEEIRREIFDLRQALAEEKQKRVDLESYLRKEIIDLRRDLNKERIQREILGGVVSMSNAPAPTSGLSPLASPGSSEPKTQRRNSGSQHSSRSSRDKRDATLKERSKKDKRESVEKEQQQSPSKQNNEEETKRELKTQVPETFIIPSTPSSIALDQRLMLEDLEDPGDFKKSKSMMSLPLIPKKGFFNRIKKGSKVTSQSLDLKNECEDDDDELYSLDSSQTVPFIKQLRKRSLPNVSSSNLSYPTKIQLLDAGVLIDGESPVFGMSDSFVKLPCEGYWIELGSPESVFSHNNWANFIRLENEDNEEPFYRTTSKDELFTYVGDDNGPMIISFKCTNGTQEQLTMEDYPVPVIVHTRSGSKRYVINGSRNKKKKLAKLIALPPKLTRVKDGRLIRDLTYLEDNTLISQRLYKFGILYSTDNQTEDQIYSNEKGSQDFNEFLEFIGRSIYLKGSTVFSGGLDTKTDTTGYQSVYTSYQSSEIMFHVSTFLPYTQNDTQQLERKRHIGNDIVVIVFLDGNKPWSPDSFCSHFNHIFCVVRKEKPVNVTPAKVPRRGSLQAQTSFLAASTSRVSLSSSMRSSSSEQISGGKKLSKDKLKSSPSSHSLPLAPSRNESTLVSRAAASFSLFLPSSSSEKTRHSVLLSNPHLDLSGLTSPNPSSLGQAPLSPTRSSVTVPVSVPTGYSSSIGSFPPALGTARSPQLSSPPSEPVDESDSAQNDDLSNDDNNNALFDDESEETPSLNPESTYYRIAIVSKKVVGSFGPYITESAIYEKTPVLREFLLSKLINGERSALRVPEFDTILSRTRSLQLQDLIKTYTPPP